MTTPLYALMGFVFWTVFVVLAIAGARVSQVLAGKAAANSFPSGQQHGGDAYWRLNRAHVNCVENLPLFAAVVLTGHVTGHTAGAFATAAQLYVFSRVGQTIAHVASGSVMAVNVRFTFFAVQMICLLYMAVAVITG
ncbi:MAG TPA: MAPEG family protein [Candidatus Binatia bacterium]|nr:MAPEG family protein [Candidatus Binatia bacterium]